MYNTYYCIWRCLESILMPKNIEVTYFYFSILASIFTMTTLFLTIYWRHTDTRGNLITYVKCIDEMMWLVIENTGKSGIKIEGIDIDKAIFCGTNINVNIMQGKTWLEPCGKLRYLLGNNYIHDGGIEIKGTVYFRYNYNSQNVKEHKIEIEFRRTKAWCTDYTTEGELAIIHHDLDRSNERLKEISEKALSISHMSCDVTFEINGSMYLISKEESFNFKFYEKSKPNEINVKNFDDEFSKSVIGKKHTKYIIDFYCIYDYHNTVVYDTLRDWVNPKKLKDKTLDECNTNINNNDIIYFNKSAYTIDNMTVDIGPNYVGKVLAYHVRVDVSE